MPALRETFSKAVRYLRFPRDMRLLREQVAQASRDLMIAADPRYHDPRHLCRAQGQVYSQNGEDGIIAEIFARIGTTNRVFVEIGVGDGIENNTRLLLESGWTGVWIDCGEENARAVRSRFREAIADQRLTFIDQMATAETVDDLLVAAGVPERIDLLSVDVDANTHHLWRAIRSVTPRVACVEYNGSYPPSLAFETPYAADATWDRSNRYGASLKALERLGEEKAMRLVGCDWHGVNAFFVAREWCDERFLGPFTAEAHHQPPRYAYEGMAGHPRHVPA